MRWTDVHETVKEWVARMTTLVECWNKLDGNVGELSSWVAAKVMRINWPYICVQYSHSFLIISKGSFEEPLLNRHS